MKPELRTVKRRSTLEGENVKMGFAPEATAHLMGVLTDLYKDRPLACVREYSTNALDAQIAAGVTRPIEVTLPGPLNPVLRIKDFGLGLDARGIAEVYSQYGASTKRNSDDYNGMLGLGCKAALSYTDQFTVVGIKDGLKTVVAVSRDEDGGGDMRIVSETQTDQPNGVEVQIPTRPSDDFAAVARDFFQWWKPGTVLVNGAEPQRPELTKITDRVFTREGVPKSRFHATVPGHRWGGGPVEGIDVVVMGGVAYPANLGIDLPWGVGFVCFVNIGEVTFTPSREALRDTKNTMDTLASLATEYTDTVVAAAKADIAAADTPGEAIRRRQKWLDSVPRQIAQAGIPASYRGRAIPATLPCSQAVVTDVRGALSHSRRTVAVTTALVPNTVFVHGYDLGSFTVTHKKKLLMAIEKDMVPATKSGAIAAADLRTIVLSKTKIGGDWVADDQRIAWDDVKALKLPRTTAQAGAVGFRITGSYDIYLDQRRHEGVPAADFDLSGGRTLVYANCGKWAIRNLGAQLDAIGAKNFLFVGMAANRIAKFERDFPNAVKLSDYIAKLRKEWVATIPADQRRKLALIAGGADMTTLSEMDAAKVDDPAIKAAIKLAKVDVKAAQSRERMFRAAGESAGLDVGSTPDPLDRDRYPLFDSNAFWRYGTPQTERQAHSYAYLNWHYNTTLKGSK